MPSKVAGCARFAALAAALSLAACDQPGDTSTDEYLTRARAYVESGEVRASIIELKNALQKDASNAEARLLLGQVYADSGNALSAEKELTRAEELGIDPSRTALHLARALLQTQRPAEALAKLDIAAGAPDIDLAVLNMLRAAAYRTQGDLEAAQARFLAVIESDPRNILALAGLGDVYLAQGRMDEMEVLAAKALAIDADNLAAREMNAELRRAQGRFGEAVPHFQKIVDARPDAVRHLVRLAHVQIATGALDHAIANLDRALRQESRNPEANYFRGLAAYQAGDFETAKDRGGRVPSNSPIGGPATLLTGAASFALNQNEQARSRLSSYLNKFPSDDRARRLLGATYLRLDESERALRVLRPLADKSMDDAELLNMIGAAAVRVGENVAARKYLQRVAELRPDSGEALAQLGTMSLQAGDPEQAIRDLEQALSKDPSLNQALAGIALAHLQAGDLDKALEAAQRFRDAASRHAAGATLMGLVRVARQESDLARRAFNDALALQPGVPDAGVNLAVLEAGAGNLDRAREVVHGVLDANPANANALRFLATIETQAGRLEDARPWLEKAIAATPDALEARILLGHLHLAGGRADQALTFTRNYLDSNPDNLRLREVVGRAQLAAGQAANAAVTLGPLVAAMPDSAAAHFLMASAFRGAGNLRGQATEFERVLSLDPNHVAAKVGMVGVYGERGELERAQRLLNELKEAIPGSPEVLELEAGMALARGRPAAAVAAYRKALAVRPSSEVAMRMALAQQQGGDAQGSLSTLKEWLAAHPDDGRVRGLLGLQYVALRRLEDARSAFQAILAADPGDVVALNNLATVESRLGNVETAATHAQRANQLKPDDPAIMDTLGAILTENGEARRAVPLLRRAVEGLPGNAEAGYHYARALAATGNKREARDVLREALDSGQAFHGKQQAWDLMRELDR